MLSAPSDGRNRLVALATAVVAACLVIASARVAYLFGQTIGLSEADRQLYSWTGVAANVLKGCLPFAVYAACAHRRWVFATVASAGLAVTITYSVIANYSYSMAGRQAGALVSVDHAEMREQLKSLGNPRPPAVVRPLLDTAKDLPEKRRLQSELAAGEVAAKLRERLDILPVSTSAAAGEDGLARTLGVDAQTIRTVLSWLLVGVMEIGELAGFYGASLLWGGKTDRTNERTAPPPPPPARAPRGSTKQWIQQYIDDAESPIHLTDARDDYFDHMSSVKKKGVGERAFDRSFALVAESAGWVRGAAGNKVVYKKQ